MLPKLPNNDWSFFVDLPAGDYRKDSQEPAGEKALTDLWRGQRVYKYTSYNINDD